MRMCKVMYGMLSSHDMIVTVYFLWDVMPRNLVEFFLPTFLIILNYTVFIRNLKR
jgi:hypothetical protein